MGGHLHRSNRTALGAVEFLRSVESVALGHEVRCSVSQAGDHSRTVAKQSHRVGMAFMDAPAGVHVMQTLVDDRSIGVQKGVWVSRDSFIGALSMSRKARKGSCSFPGVAFHSAKIAKRDTRYAPLCTTRRKSPKGEQGTTRWSPPRRGFAKRRRLPINRSKSRHGGDGATNLGKYYWHLC